jgi:hypothetical protein
MALVLNTLFAFEFVPYEWYLNKFRQRQQSNMDVIHFGALGETTICAILWCPTIFYSNIQIDIQVLDEMSKPYKGSKRFQKVIIFSFYELIIASSRMSVLIF